MYTVDEFLNARHEFSYNTKDYTIAITIIRWLEGRGVKYTVKKDDAGFLFAINADSPNAVTVANFFKGKEDET